jgi:hypothetical protein
MQTLISKMLMKFCKDTTLLRMGLDLWAEPRHHWGVGGRVLIVLPEPQKRSCARPPGRANGPGEIRQGVLAARRRLRQVVTRITQALAAPCRIVAA